MKKTILQPGSPVVEIRRASGREPMLRRQRELFESAAGLNYPYLTEPFAGRGIVICVGGTKYFPSVYVLVRLLRKLGCELPIEVWHLGEKEMWPGMRQLLEPHGVECIDALAMRRIHPARRLAGWELKCYALLHSRFTEVLLLDADNCPVRDPSFLFRSRPYQEHGAIFWPDFWEWQPEVAVRTASGFDYQPGRQFESGQIVVDKRRCWKALNVAMHLNEFSDWWYPSSMATRTRSIWPGGNVGKAMP